MTRTVYTPNRTIDQGSQTLIDTSVTESSRSEVFKHYYSFLVDKLFDSNVSEDFCWKSSHPTVAATDIQSTSVSHMGRVDSSLNLNEIFSIMKDHFLDRWDDTFQIMWERRIFVTVRELAFMNEYSLMRWTIENVDPGSEQSLGGIIAGLEFAQITEGHGKDLDILLNGSSSLKKAMFEIMAGAPEFLGQGDKLIVSVYKDPEIEDTYPVIAVDTANQGINAERSIDAFTAFVDEKLYYPTDWIAVHYHEKKSI